MEQNLNMNYTVLNISSKGEIRNLFANFLISTLRMYCRNKTSCKQYIRDASFSLQVKIVFVVNLRFISYTLFVELDALRVCFHFSC